MRKSRTACSLHGRRARWVLAIASFGTAVMAMPPPASAATLRVPSSYPTIQAAIAAAAPDDIVLVGPGRYDENLDTGTKRLTLIGEAGAEATIVDGGRRGSVLRFTGGGLVRGLTFRQGQAQWGGGIFVGGSLLATLRDNVIEDNIAGYFVDSGIGGGIAVDAGARVVIEANVIRNNYAGASGGGVYDFGVEGNQVLRNVISGNGCHVWGGGVIVSSTDLIGNLIRGNWADHFGGGVGGGGRTITGNTIVENYLVYGVVGGAGMHISATSQYATISNNLIAFNNGRQAGVGFVCVVDFYGSPRIECNNSFGNDGGDYYFLGAVDTTGMRNFSADPLFCGRESGQFTLSDGSPCAPASSSGCGLIGAFPVACTVTPTRRGTWGRLKVRYR